MVASDQSGAARLRFSVGQAADACDVEDWASDSEQQEIKMKETNRHALGLPFV